MSPLLLLLSYLSPGKTLSFMLFMKKAKKHEEEERV